MGVAGWGGWASAGLLVVAWVAGVARGVGQGVLALVALAALGACRVEQVVRPSQALEEQEVLPSLALLA